MDLQNLEEKQLVEEARTNANAFGLLYRLYVRKIYNYFYYKTFELKEAEDLTSETFTKALRNLHTFKKNSNFQAWLYKIAHNLLVDYYRKQKPTVNIEQITLSYTEHHLQNLAKQEQELLLQQKITQLSLLEQEVIYLKYQQTMSNKEIGKIIRKSEGAVKQIAHRAIAKLKERMQEK